VNSSITIPAAILWHWHFRCRHWYRYRFHYRYQAWARKLLVQSSGPEK